MYRQRLTRQEDCDLRVGASRRQFPFDATPSSNSKQSSHAPRRRGRPSAHSRTASAPRLVVRALERLVIEDRLLQLWTFQQHALEFSFEQLLHRAFSRLLGLGPRHALLGAIAEDAILRQAPTHLFDTVDPRLCRRVRDVVLELRPTDLLTHARTRRRFALTVHVEGVVAIEIVEKVVHAHARNLEGGPEVRESPTAHDELLEIVD